MPKILKTNMRKGIRRHWLPIGFVLMFAALGAYLLLISHAATPIEPSVAWTSKGSELENINSGLCLGIPQTTQAASGTKLLLETCSATSNNQKWSLTWGNGSVANTVVKNGFSQCMDDTAAGTNAGNPIQIYTCNNHPTSQTWSTGYGDGTIRIHGLCLGVNGNAKTSGSTIVLSGCNYPTPSVNITSPGSGSTISGQSATISATASVVSGSSIQSITISINGATIVTCTNATTCSKAWNTTSVVNGTYTLTADATASGSVTALTSIPVVVNNPSNGGTSQPPPSSGGGGTSSSGGGTSSGSNNGSNSSNGFGGVSDSTGSGTINDSGNTGSDTSGDTTISSGSDTSSSDNSSSSSSNSNTNSSSGPSSNLGSKRSSPLKAVGIVFSTLILVVVTVFLALFMIKRRQTASVTPYPVEIQNLPSYPQEDSGTSAARLNWWLPEDERQRLASQAQQPSLPVTSPTPAAPGANEPPDMFAEGRKRLEEEERRRQAGGQ